MKNHSSTFTYIGLMTAFYGLLMMGAVYAASSISGVSPVSIFSAAYNALVRSLSGVSSLLVLIGVAMLAIGLFLWKKAEQ